MVFAKGFDQVNTAELDIPFSEYLANLDAPPAIADLLRAQSYTLTGALPHEFSALVYLREISGFDNDPAYSFFASLARVDIGSGGLAERVAAEISDHIRLGEPVTAVTDSGDRLDVVTATGERYSARRAVLAAPLNTIGDIGFSPALPPALARLVSAGHTGRCIKVWSKLAGMEFVFAMGWPGIVECTVINEVGEGNEKRSITACFGLAPDLAVERADLVQAGLDKLGLGASRSRRSTATTGSAIRSRRAPGWRCEPGTGAPTSLVSRPVGAQSTWLGPTLPRSGQAGWTGPSNPAARRQRRSTRP